jgi:hypothetical protein
MTEYRKREGHQVAGSNVQISENYAFRVTRSLEGWSIASTLPLKITECSYCHSVFFLRDTLRLLKLACFGPTRRRALSTHTIAYSADSIFDSVTADFGFAARFAGAVFRSRYVCDSASWTSRFGLLYRHW